MGITYPNEINRILYSPGGDVGKEIRAYALDVAEEARAIARTELGKNPFDRPRTGKYARSFYVTVTPGTNEFQVGNTAEMAQLLELGSKRHIIRPVRVDYLQFRGRDGRYHSLKLVKHPGTRAYLILNRAANNVIIRRYGKSKRTI